MRLYYIEFCIGYLVRPLKSVPCASHCLWELTQEFICIFFFAEVIHNGLK